MAKGRAVLLRKLSSTETGKAAAGKLFTFGETLEHIKPYANVITACGTFLIVGGGFVKVISDIKGDVSDIRGDVGKLRQVTDEKIGKVQATTDEKFSTTNEKIGKVQATTNEKIGKVQATTDEKIGKVQATTDEKFSTTNEKIGKVQATTNEKFDTVKAQMALKATNTYLKLNHNEKYVTVRATSPAASVGVADSSAKQNGV